MAGKWGGEGGAAVYSLVWKPGYTCDEEGARLPILCTWKESIMGCPHSRGEPDVGEMRLQREHP